MDGKSQHTRTAIRKLTRRAYPEVRDEFDVASNPGEETPEE